MTPLRGGDKQRISNNIKYICQCLSRVNTSLVSGYRVISVVKRYTVKVFMGVNTLWLLIRQMEAFTSILSQRPLVFLLSFSLSFSLFRSLCLSTFLFLSLSLSSDSASVSVFRSVSLSVSLFRILCVSLSSSVYFSLFLALFLLHNLFLKFLRPCRK